MQTAVAPGRGRRRPTEPAVDPDREVDGGAGGSRLISMFRRSSGAGVPAGLVERGPEDPGNGARGRHARAGAGASARRPGPRGSDLEEGLGNWLPEAARARAAVGLYGAGSIATISTTRRRRPGAAHRDRATEGVLLGPRAPCRAGRSACSIRRRRRAVDDDGVAGSTTARGSRCSPPVHDARVESVVDDMRASSERDGLAPRDLAGVSVSTRVARPLVLLWTDAADVTRGAAERRPLGSRSSPPSLRARRRSGRSWAVPRPRSRGASRRARSRRHRDSAGSRR